MSLCDRCRAEIKSSIDLPSWVDGPNWLINGETRHVPPMIRRIFEILYSRRSVYISRESIITLVYNFCNDPPNDRIVNVHISKLRKLLIGSEFTISRYEQELGWRLILAVNHRLISNSKYNRTE